MSHGREGGLPPLSLNSFQAERGQAPLLTLRFRCLSLDPRVSALIRGRVSF